MILDPSGEANQLSSEWLQGSPFPNYLIPGLVLSLGIGVLSIVAAFAGLLHYHNFPLLLILEGLVLCIWIIVQMMIIPGISFLQPLFGLLGLSLIVMGIYQSRSLFTS